MRRLFGVLAAVVICWLYTPNVYACDVCGVNLSNQQLGLLPQFSQHFAGIQYFQTANKGSHPSLFSRDITENSRQVYRVWQLWGRYQLSQRIQVFAFIPYVSNANSDSVQTIGTSGIGDPSLTANYAVPLPNAEKQLLLVGMGLKLPAGRYTRNEGNALASLSTGSGSLDLLGNINYTRKLNSWGFNAELSYVFTGTNRSHYKFGNRTHIAYTAFSWWKYGDWTWMPQVGVRGEHSLKDYDNYDRKWLNTQTGGVQSYATIGLQTLYKSVGFRAQAQIPLYQNYASGYIKTQYKIETGLFILF